MCHFAGSETVVDTELAIDALHLCADSVDGDDLFHGYFPIRISKGQAVDGERETR
jgi:hypothetical protein